MKKSIIVVGMAAVLLMLAASCKKENSTSKVVLRAGIEGSPSKTYVDVAGPFTSWKETDKILVNGNEMYITERHAISYGTEGQTGYHTADFACDNWKGSKPSSSTQLYAISPAIAQSQNNDGTWKSKISLPATQTYIANGIMDDLPMAVSNAGSVLNFHNLTCIYGVPVRTDKQGGLEINKVELVCADANPQYPLVAEAWYPHYGNELQDVEIIGGQSTTITLNCGENGVLIPTTKDGIEFFFAAFPVPVKNLDIKFYQGNELVATINKELSGVPEANRIYDLVESPENNNRTPWTINPNR